MVDKGGRNKFINLVLCISMEDFLFYKIYDSKFNSNHYIKFLLELEDKLKNHKTFSESYWKGKVVIVQDNCNIHRSKIFMKNFKFSYLKFCYLAPYSPKFNNCELVFNYLKSSIKI